MSMQIWGKATAKAELLNERGRECVCVVLHVLHGQDKTFAFVLWSESWVCSELMAMWHATCRGSSCHSPCNDVVATFSEQCAFLLGWIELKNVYLNANTNTNTLWCCMCVRDNDTSLVLVCSCTSFKPCHRLLHSWLTPMTDASQRQGRGMGQGRMGHVACGMGRHTTNRVSQRYGVSKSFCSRASHATLCCPQVELRILRVENWELRIGLGTRFVARGIACYVFRVTLSLKGLKGKRR